VDQPRLKHTRPGQLSYSVHAGRQRIHLHNTPQTDHSDLTGVPINCQRIHMYDHRVALRQRHVQRRIRSAAQVIQGHLHDEAGYHKPVHVHEYLRNAFLRSVLPELHNFVDLLRCRVPPNRQVLLSERLVGDLTPSRAHLAGMHVHHDLLHATRAHTVLRDADGGGKHNEGVHAAAR